ncbi:MAG: hypothetical protein QW292_09300 [Candidatus Parvarchaeota archaeon]
MIFNRDTKKYKYVSQISPDFFELEIIGFSEFASSVISVDAVATPLADRDGYGIAQTLAAVTDRGYWYEVMLLYQWPKFLDFKGREGWYMTRGYSVQYHIWTPDKKAYVMDESDIIKDIRGERRVVIKDGDPINLRMEIRGEYVIFQVIGRETYEVKYPSYGAQTFIGMERPQGYYTGFATEYYHTSIQYGAVNPRPIVVKMREPSEVRRGYIEIAESRRPFFTDIDENILLLISPVEFYPEFNVILGPGRFSGNGKEFSVEVQEREE